MDLTEKTVQSTHVFEGEMLNVFKDTVQLPGGGSSTREFVKHIGAVAVVALTKDRKVVMERQYRYPVRRTVFEIPAGKLDAPEEDTLEAAKRELHEETGITADDWICMGDFCPAPAYCNEVITLYLARGLHSGEQNLDCDEFLEVEQVPFDDLIADIMDGKITDGKTMAALLKAKNLIM